MSAPTRILMPREPDIHMVGAGTLGGSINTATARMVYEAIVRHCETVGTSALNAAPRSRPEAALDCAVAVLRRITRGSRDPETREDALSALTRIAELRRAEVCERDHRAAQEARERGLL